MTVTSLVTEQTYATNGVTTSFPIGFPFFDDADLTVIYTQTGASEAILSSGFTITGGEGSTGTLTFTTAPATGTLKIQRNTVRKQNSDYSTAGRFPAQSHEDALDRLTMIAQEMDRDIGELEAPGGGESEISDPKTFYAIDYGVNADGVTDNTLSLQAAIDAANAAGGGIVMMPAGTIKVSAQGTIGTRDYCILMKPNVLLSGSSLLTSTIKFNRTAKDTDVIRTISSGSFGAWTQKNIGLRNFTVDGDSATSGAGNGFNIWMVLVENLWIENVRSLDSTSWGIRIDACRYVTLSNVAVDHGPDSTADGIHFVDTVDVVGSNINIYTEGDDAFIIEAVNQNVENYNISGLTCEAPTAGIAGGRGILLLRDQTLGGGVARTMKSINIFATCSNCYGPAVSIGSSLNLEGVNINASATNCASLIAAYIGLVAHPTYMRGCSFDLRGANFTKNDGNPVAVFSPADSNTKIEDNQFNIAINNPANNQVVASINGTRWNGTLNFNYNPNSDKTLFTNGLDIYATDSVFNVTGKGAGNNIFLRSGATNNTIAVGKLSSAATYNISASSGTIPYVVGKADGVISGEVIFSGADFPAVPLYAASGTDIAAALNALIDKYTSGATIALPRGSFTASSTIVLDNPNIRIVGASGGSNHNTGATSTSGGTIITGKHTSGAVIKINNTGCGLENIVVDSDATRRAAAAGSNFGILIEGPDTASGSAAKFNLSNVQVLKQPHHGIVISGRAEAGLFSQVHVDNVDGHGVVIDGGTLTGRTNKSRPGQFNWFQGTVSRTGGQAIKIGDPATENGSGPERPYRVYIHDIDCFYNLQDNATYTLGYAGQIYGEEITISHSAFGGGSEGAEPIKGGLWIAGHSVRVISTRFPSCEDYIAYVANAHASFPSNDVELYFPGIVHDGSGGFTYNPAVYQESGARNVRVIAANRSSVTTSLLNMEDGQNSYIDFKDERIFAGKHVSTFKSGEYTVADDAEFYIDFNGTVASGIMQIADAQGAGGAANVHFRCGDVSAFCRPTVIGTGGPTYTGTTGTLTGTTGTDTHMTIAADTASNRLYIENRTGASRTFQFTLTSSDNWIETIAT